MDLKEHFDASCGIVNKVLEERKVLLAALALNESEINRTITFDFFLFHDNTPQTSQRSPSMLYSKTVHFSPVSRSCFSAH